MAKVVCIHGCRGKYHCTTDQFNPDVSPHGGMFKLLEPWRSNGWSSFPEHEGVTGAALECPDCGAPYLNSANRVTLDGPVKAVKKEETKGGYSPELIARVLELNAEGKKPGEIGKEVGLHHVKVAAIIKKYSGK